MSATLGNIKDWQPEAKYEDHSLLDQAMMQTLNTLQNALNILVELGDAGRFQTFQKCAGELFRNAAEKANGKKLQ